MVGIGVGVGVGMGVGEGWGVGCTGFAGPWVGGAEVAWVGADAAPLQAASISASTAASSSPLTNDEANLNRRIVPS